MIKAIETVYNGYKFRSRLEARWAVFFDALGIEYQYEVEGFEFEGSRYLPDFWLPKFEVWAEIKPRGKALSSEYERKLTSFSTEIKQPLIVFHGEPYQWAFDVTVIPASVVGWVTGVTSFSFVDFSIIRQTDNDRIGYLTIEFMRENGDRVGWVVFTKAPCITDIPDDTDTSQFIEQAYLAARQARF